MKYASIVAVAALTALPCVSSVAGTVDLPRYPAASPDGNVVVFSWRGDLWKAPSSGGAAVRLTSNPANEGRSAFSPDGAQIVFESDRDGGRNLFVMNSDGGDVRQITVGESSVVLSGTGVDAAGRPVALFEASRENDLYRGTRPYMVPLAGGTIERVHGAFGGHPEATRDGAVILFERGGSTWTRRGYQGPDQRDVWSFNRADGSFVRHTDWKGNDGWAFAAGDDIVFISDRGNGRSMNLWRKPRSAPASEAGHQLTNFEDDVRDLSVSADGRVALFTVWETLYRLDLTKPGAQAIKVPLQGAEDEEDRMRPRNVGRDVSEAALSPDGKTIALIAYGDVYVKGVDERAPFVRVTRTPWRERDVTWMPDGAKLLFSSDSDGNDSIYEATVQETRGELRATFKERTAPSKPAAPAATAADAPPAANAQGAQEPPANAPPAAPPADAQPAKDSAVKESAAKDAKKPEKKDEGARWADAVQVAVKPLVATAASERSPSPSPDGKQLAYRRDLRTLVVRDLATGKEHDLRTGFDPSIDWRWSPDSHLIAFRQDDDNFNSDIWIVPADGSAAPVNISRHPDGDASPRWSADGKVLAFSSTRVNNEGDVYLVFLDKDLEGMQRFELDQYFKDAAEAVKKKAAAATASTGKRADARKAGGKGGKEGKDGKEGSDAKEPSEAAVAEGADKDKEKEKEKDEGAPSTPAKPLDLQDAYKRLRRLTSMPGNEFDLELAPSGERVYFISSGEPGGLYSVAWSGGEPKKLAATGALQHINLAGDKLVLVGKTGASIASLPGGDAKSIEFSDIVEIDLGAQSSQKFGELSRIMGSLFYSPTMNGTDWPKLTAKWAKLAAAARTDEEFDYIANRYIGELNASHLGVSSPRGDASGRIASGKIGAQTRAVEGGFEVLEILPDSPAASGPTPLAVGDVIVAVAGQPVGAASTMEALFRGTVGKETVVRVKRTPAKGGAVIEVDAIVVPAGAAEIAALAYDETLRRARTRVEELSGGRLGYIHIRSMDQPSLDAYERDLYAAADGKDGLIIDVRNNGGGWTADRLLSSIMVQEHAYTIPRGADPARKGHYPADRLFIQRYSLPINMLANEKSFSNAEITAHAFKTLKRGTLLGQQTYGGVISTGSASLIDGTTVRTPGRGWYLPDGTDMELHGAIPDIVVLQTPEDEAAGHDAQLDAAVADLLKRLKK